MQGCEFLEGDSVQLYLVACFLPVRGLQTLLLLFFWSNDRGPHARTDQVILLWVTQITARWLLLERGVRKRGESLL